MLNTASKYQTIKYLPHLEPRNRYNNDDLYLKGKVSNCPILDSQFLNSEKKAFSRGQKEMWLAVWRTSVFPAIKTVNVMEKFLWILRSFKKYIWDIIKPKTSISYSQTWPHYVSFSFFFLFALLTHSVQPRKQSFTNTITRITLLSMQMLLYKHISQCELVYFKVKQKIHNCLKRNVALIPVAQSSSQIPIKITLT